VAIINEYLAEQTFGDAEAVGRIIDLLPARTPWTNRPGRLLVVGVANDVKEVGLNEVRFADIYVPFAQMPTSSIEVVVRGSDGLEVAAGVRAAALALDPDVPVTGTSTFEQRVDNALRADRFNLVLVALFAAMALLLAGIGVYGAVAHAVQARTREVGIRLAFGARPLGLCLMMLRQIGIVGIAAGLIGLAAMVAIARLSGDALYLVPGSHNGLLFEVSMTDPVVLTAAIGTVLVVVLAAALVPARRVTGADPFRALKAE
jgi:ABC-type antimicrobial peptide transport system permease subunit